MNYAKIIPVDSTNGDGIRVSLFVSGCKNYCRECFNKEAWDFDYGEKFDREVEDRIIKLLKPSYVWGLSLLGGEPFQQDPEVMCKFLDRVKQTYPNKEIWCWTGLVYENIKNFPMMQYIDVLIDGRFVVKLKNPSLKFRGSSNQRIIDVKRSKEENKVVLRYD